MSSLLEKILRRPDKKEGSAEAEALSSDMHRLEGILEISRDISSILDSRVLLDRILDRVVEVTGARRGFLLLCEDENMDEEEPLRVEVARNIERKDLEDKDFRFSNTVVRETMKTRKGVVVTNAPEDPRFLASHSVVTYNLLSILCVPMQVGSHLVGIIYLDNPLVSHQFNESDLSLLEVFASQAAVAIRNALDYRRIESLNEELGKRFQEVETLKERISRENIYLKEEIDRARHFTEIVAVSKTMQKVLSVVERVAPADSTTLLLGETGTGKELLAQAIHRRSSRSERALITVNCAALPESLLESELFGHEKGSFTGAYARKLGRFELADGGSIFLDEIGDVSPGVQAKLLRVLQEGEFERVGGVKTLKVNVRVIAATNKDLARAVEENTFREDLYYRLNVLPIQIPPLRDRREDIMPLVRHFVDIYNAKLGKDVDTIPREMAEQLVAYDWPGNVRELMNVIERAVVLSESGFLTLYDSLVVQSGGRESSGDISVEPYEFAVRKFRKRLIATAVGQTGGNKAAAARLLKIQPTYLSRLIRQLDINL